LAYSPFLLLKLDLMKRILVSAVCFMIFMAMAACTKDDKLKVEPEKPVIAGKYSSANGTFNVPGDITSLTIN